MSVRAPRWYALRVKTRQELSSAAGLQTRGLEVFVPTQRERRMWSDRIRSQEVALFPGYVFVRFDPSPAALLTVRRQPGVIDVLGWHRGRAPEVPDDIIFALKRMCGHQRTMTVAQSMPPGAPVQIGRGPLRGVRGEVVHSDGSQRLVVRIGLLGQSVSCALDATDVVLDERPAGLSA